MEKQSYFREYIRYTMFHVMGMLGLSCYILADTYFVSKGIGVKGLSALNLAIPVFNLVNGTGLMLGIGGATRYSVYCGAKDEEGREKIFSNTLYPAGVFSILFLLAGIFLSEPLAVLVGAKENTLIFSMTETYLRVILLFSPAFLLNNILNSFVRNDGELGLAMLAMLGGSISNIILDYILIFPLHMGILGAVLATGAAPVVGIGILSGHWRRKKNRFGIKKVAYSFDMGKMTMSLGLPSLISEVSSGVVILTFNYIFLNLKGDEGVAAYGVIANISLVVLAVCSGMANGVQPLVSRAYAGCDQKGLRTLFFYGVGTVFLFTVGIYLVLFAFAGKVTAVFNSEHNMVMQTLAEDGLKLYFSGAFFAGFNLLVSVCFTSTERALPAQILTVLRGLVLIVFFAFLLSRLFGITGLWLAFPVTEAITAITGAVVIFATKIFLIEKKGKIY